MVKSPKEGQSQESLGLAGNCAGYLSRQFLRAPNNSTFALQLLVMVRVTFFEYLNSGSGWVEECHYLFYD